MKEQTKGWNRDETKGGETKGRDEKKRKEKLLAMKTKGNDKQK